MYICDFCHKPSKPGEKKVAVVVEVREVDYRDEKNAVVGTGLETVREKAACPRCLKRGRKAA